MEGIPSITYYLRAYHRPTPHRDIVDKQTETVVCIKFSLIVISCACLLQMSSQDVLCNALAVCAEKMQTWTPWLWSQTWTAVAS